MSCIDGCVKLSLFLFFLMVWRYSVSCFGGFRSNTYTHNYTCTKDHRYTITLTYNSKENIMTTVYTYTSSDSIDTITIKCKSPIGTCHSKSIAKCDVCRFSRKVINEVSTISNTKSISCKTRTYYA